MTSILKKGNLVRWTAFLMLALMFSGQILPAAAKVSLGAAEKLGPRVMAAEYLVKASALLSRDDAKHNFFIGLWYHKTHKLAKAEEYYRRAIELDPKIANTHYQLARVFFASGKLNKALEEINQESEVNPVNKRSYYIRGLTLGYLGRYAEAELSFKEFLKTPLAQQSNGWGGYVDLGWVLMKQKKYEDTLWILKEAEGLFAPNTWVYNGLGSAYFSIKDYAKAEEYYQKAYDGAKTMTVEEWLAAYPAHDPRTAEDGIRQIIATLEKNLALTEEKRDQKNP